ncbi:uncharacterized protein [Parasteatoda tepidariorum]|uniref:uncharacterized protein n=1 Tax=Parasteatoda tepidariorum TaxID=114398 RepID=UPI001C7247CD|nr:uncharacterized protein LOC110282031 [Parasteatoda tepidariorum]
MIWLVLAVLSMTENGDAIEFEPFFPHDTFFSAEDPFRFLPPSYKLDSTLSLRQDFNAPYASESADLPLYTDGKATLPQKTLSKLERDYKTQLHKVASANADPGLYGRNGRTRTFSDYSFPSTQSESRFNSESFKREPTSKNVEIQRGFVPILGKRSPSSTVLKDLEPPILTASSSFNPQRFKASSSRVHPDNSSLTSSPTPGSDSRKLDFGRDARVLAISTSSSESVISSVVPNGVNEDDKATAKKTLEINCNGSRDLGWCELDGKYPRKYVDQVVSNCQDVIERMYVEVPHSFEKLSDDSNFKTQLDDSGSRAKERGNRAHDAWSWAAYFHQGSLCDSEAGFLRPETAKDTSGKWNIILQTDTLKQRVPIEMCRKTNTACKKSCGLKSSQCLQKYNYHLLLSVNPLLKHDCPFMKLYRFPSACVCHAE